jgi:hypothetical protein
VSRGTRGGPQHQRAPCCCRRPLAVKLAGCFFLVPWIKVHCYFVVFAR